MTNGYRESNRYIRRIENHQGDFIMSPANDFVFKMLFGNENNKDILISFLSAVLKIKPEKFEELELINTELTREFAEDRMGILDVRVRLNDGSQVDIEIQLTRTKYMAERTLYYWSKMYTSNIESGDSYSKLKRCVTINILDFYATVLEQVYSKFHITEAKTGHRLTDVLEIYYLELPKLKDSQLIKIIDEKDPIIQWMMFLGAENKEVLDMLSQESPEIKKATSILEVMSKDKEARMYYEAREAALHDKVTSLEEAREKGIEEGMEKGIEKGMEKGIEEGKIEIVKNLISSKTDIEFIMKISGLSREKIENIQANMK